MKLKRHLLSCLALILLIGCQHSKTYSSQGEERGSQPVALLAALPEELESLKHELVGFQVTHRGDGEFVTGKLNGISVVSTLSGVGKVNAAITAQRLVSEFQAKAFIFTGVGGGLNPQYEIGDVVIARKTFQHDYGWQDRELVLHAVGTLPEIGIGKGDEPVQIDLARFWPPMSSNQDSFLVALGNFSMAVQREFSPVTVNGRQYAPQIRLNGVVATGDQFIAHEQKKVRVRRLGGDVVEMEGASVAQVAHRNRIPCLLIRSISDKAGGKAKVDFSKFVKAVASNNERLISLLFHDDSFSAYLRQL